MLYFYILLIERQAAAGLLSVATAGYTMLIIQPSGGLCNRMRVINSGRELARRRKEKLLVLWYLCPELNCPFESLFQPVTDPDIKIINIRSLYDPRKLFYQLTASQRFGNDDILQNKTDGTLHEDFFRSLKRNVYLFTWEHFYPVSDYSLYRPAPALQERIDSFTREFAPRCTGVHIRRTDNAVSMGKSTTEQFIAEMEKELSLHPETRFFLATDDQTCTGVHIRRTDNAVSMGKSTTEQFIAEMEKELSLHPETRFFLATDDQTEEDRLRALFPGKIISNQSRTIDRNSVAGMHDALLDLYCLAACDKLIGSYWSSFTDIAGKIISNQSRTIDRNSVAGMHDALLDLYCLAACDKLIGSYWSSFTDIAADMRGIEKVIAGESNDSL